MKLLYCYVGFLDRNGNPSSLRGMKELELNFSTTHVYRFEKRADSQSDILHCFPRKTPLPDYFWANGDLETNIYNIIVIAGMNGSGKSTAIHYLTDLLNYIYHGFGQTLSDRDRNIRHDPSNNRNLLLFDTDDGLRILYFQRGEISNRLDTESFPKSSLFLGLSEAEDLLRGMKVINLSNTLTQRDYQLHNGNDERLRNSFIYDCTLGAAIGSDIGGFFPYEVYKQVAYLFEPRQAEARWKLKKTITELRLPHSLRLHPLEKRFEKLSASLTGAKVGVSEAMPVLYSSLPFQLAFLCAVSYLENMIALARRKVYIYPILFDVSKLAVQFSSEILRTALTEFMDKAEKWIRNVISSVIISSSSDRTLRVWDADTGQCLQVLEGHSRGVSCMAVLPDGRVVSGSYDNTLRVWDIATGQCLKVLKGHSRGVSCVAVLPDGRVISGSADSTLRVWDAATGQCLQIMEGHSGAVNCVAVLPDGRVVSGSDDSTLRVWDTATGQCLQIMGWHNNEGVSCVAVISDGHVVSGSYDSTLWVWDTVTGQCLQTLEGHRGRVNCVTMLPYGLVASGSNDNTLRVWDTDTGLWLKNMMGHSRGVTCVTVLPDGRVVSGSDDDTLRIWDTVTGQCLLTMEGHRESVNCVAVLPGGRKIDDTIDKLISNRADHCRQYIDYVLNDPNDLFSQFVQSDTDPDAFELTIPYERSNASEHLEKSLIEFMDLYHKICTPSYTVDFDWGLSSGEENLLRMFSWLFHIFPRSAENGEYRYWITNNPEDIYNGGNRCDSVLLFIDEADLTFHPEWQRRLIHILTAFLPTIYPPDCVKDLQLVLTTHSPLLLGDVPRDNIHFLFREDGGDLQKVDTQSETFGQNIHTILKNSFFLENGTVGQFASNKINTLAEKLDEIYKSGDVSNLSAEELERIRRFIAMVAPGVLRVRLEQMLQKVEELAGRPDADLLVKQAKRLSREELRYMLRQLREDEKL